MALHQLAIAKASFSASLLRPDPTSIPRDGISHLHTLLDAAVSKCSPTNIQHCKDWLLRNTVPSSTRITAFGKYLVALSASFADSEDRTLGVTVNLPKPSSRRRRLHILYLLNDLLHHTRYHNETASAFSTLTGTLQPHLVELLEYAASYHILNCPKHHRRIGELLNVWEQHGYYNPHYINKLRETAENGANSDLTKTDHAKVETNGSALPDSSKASLRDAPFIMPATHGDPSTAYYDLPAGNMMPHIVPNSAISINPKLVKPLQFVAGPADESLVNALKGFMKEVGCIGSLEDDFDEGNQRDIDELGQAIIKDLGTGEIVGGDGYYGWSRGFCQKMKRRKASKGVPDQARRVRSDSPDRGFSLRKRRRHGYSGSSTRRSRSRGRSRSYSRSSSRSPAMLPMTRYHDRNVSYSRSSSHSRSVSRSKSPPQRYRSLRSRSRSSSRSKSKSYSPPGDLPHRQLSPPYPPGGTPSHPQGPSPPPPPMFPGDFGRGFPLGPGGIPIPPPPPPLHHTGTWPPPPPPIPTGMNFFPQPGQFPPFPGFVPQPLPPPPSGPRGFQDPNIGSRSLPSQVPQASGAWGQQQQQQQQGGHVGYGGYGSGGLSAGKGQSYNSRGRGGLRGGWRS